MSEKQISESSTRGRLFLFIGLVVIIAVIAVVAVIVTGGDDDDSEAIVEVTEEPSDNTDEVTTDDATPEAQDSTDSNDETDVTLVDRTDPQAVGEALIRAILERDEPAILTYICEIDQQLVGNDALLAGYIFEHTSGLPNEGTIDASGISVSLLSVDETIASLEYCGEVIVSTEDNISETITIEANALELKNTNGEWGFCVQSE